MVSSLAGSMQKKKTMFSRVRLLVDGAAVELQVM